MFPPLILYHMIIHVCSHCLSPPVPVAGNLAATICLVNCSTLLCLCVYRSQSCQPIFPWGIILPTSVSGQCVIPSLFPLITISTHFKNDFCQHLSPFFLIEDVAHICNRVTFFCHSLWSIVNYLLETYRIKVHSLCCEVLWILTNAQGHVSIDAAAWHLIILTHKRPGHMVWRRDFSKLMLSVNTRL